MRQKGTESKFTREEFEAWYVSIYLGLAEYSFSTFLKRSSDSQLELLLCRLETASFLSQDWYEEEVEQDWLFLQKQQLEEVKRERKRREALKL